MVAFTVQGRVIRRKSLWIVTNKGESSMAHKKVTSPKIATIASRALRSNNTSKNTKKIAGSALAQTPGKHRGKK
jgi:hypothetical protein